MAQPFHTVSQLKDGISAILGGTTVNNVSDLYRALERAAATVLQRADIPESSGQTNYMFYNGVYDYPAPPTIFGGALIDVQPQGITRNPSDYVYKQPIELFDRTKCLLKNGVSVTFEHYLGQGIMRVAQVRAPLKAELDPMNATTGWVAAGTASGLTTDTTVYYQSPASLRFNLTTGIGTLTKTIPAVNLASYQGVAVTFLAIYTPDVADLTSLSVNIGSSASNYTTVTATQGFLGAFVANEWTLVAFDLSLGTNTGTPNFSALTYLQVGITAAAAITNFRVGGLFASLPVPYTVLYQSDAIFLSNGQLSETITSADDQIILADAAYLLYEYESALAVAIQQGSPNMEQIMGNINSVLNGARARNGTVITLGIYDQYRSDNPSEQIRQIGSYYDSNNIGQ